MEIDYLIRDYLQIILLGIILSPISFALSFSIRSGGSATLPMIGQATGAIINILLGAIFIIQLGWGVKGAAWATVIVIGISSLVNLFANSVCSIFVNRMVVRYGGDIARSAYGIVNQVAGTIRISEGK